MPASSYGQRPLLRHRCQREPSRVPTWPYRPVRTLPTPLRKHFQDLRDTGRVEGPIRFAYRDPSNRAAVVEHPQPRIPSNRIDLGRLHRENVGDLVPGVAFVLEDVLNYSEKVDSSERDTQLLGELPSQRRLGGLSKLDAAADRAVKRFACHPVRTLEDENVPRSDGQPYRDVPDR